MPLEVEDQKLLVDLVVELDNLETLVASLHLRETMVDQTMEAVAELVQLADQCLDHKLDLADLVLHHQ